MPTGGGGGGGLSSVTTNSTLTGTGTSGSPLGVTGEPISFFTQQWNQGPDGQTGANQVYINGFYTASALTFAHIGVNVYTSDNAHNYDLGIYTKAGTLLANIGAQTLPSTGIQAFATLQGSQTITPGLYVFALTGTAFTAQLGICTQAATWVRNVNYTSSSGGALPASISAVSFSISQYTIFLYLY